MIASPAPGLAKGFLDVGSQIAVGCLIKRISRDPILRSVLDTLTHLFERMASEKYDKGYVEVDGTVCIKTMDLPLVSAN
jgi:hypothetical protein